MAKHKSFAVATDVKVTRGDIKQCVHRRVVSVFQQANRFPVKTDSMQA
jgi:hypothetical protein